MKINPDIDHLVHNHDSKANLREQAIKQASLTIEKSLLTFGVNWVIDQTLYNYKLKYKDEDYRGIEKGVVQGGVWRGKERGQKKVDCRGVKIHQEFTGWVVLKEAQKGDPERELEGR